MSFLSTLYFLNSNAS